VSALILVLGVWASTALAQSPSGDKESTASLLDLQLPSFQQAAIAADKSIQDVMLEPTGVTWLLGRTSIWRWNAGGKGLKRLKLGDAKVADQDVLRHLGTDGVSVFAAGESALYQAQWAQGRVFRYPLKQRGPSFGFSGYGDDFWLLHAASLFQ